MVFKIKGLFLQFLHDDNILKKRNISYEQKTTNTFLDTPAVIL